MSWRRIPIVLGLLGVVACSDPADPGIPEPEEEEEEEPDPSPGARPVTVIDFETADGLG